MLGILSSVGLGTGLHTFVLYLGPFIAKVTLAATECNSVDFPLTGPQAFLCPNNVSRTIIWRPKSTIVNHICRCIVLANF